MGLDISTYGMLARAWGSMAGWEWLLHTTTMSL